MREITITVAIDESNDFDNLSHDPRTKLMGDQRIQRALEEEFGFEVEVIEVEEQ